jgi:hypothetical protein
MIDFSHARSGSHVFIMKLWERLPAANETRLSHAGYLINSLVTFFRRKAL